LGKSQLQGNLMLTTSAFLALAMQCAPSIHPATLIPIVKTESSFNPWAIGVVGRALPRQPQSLDEAVTAVKALVEQGADFSIGLGQINRQHFDVGKPERVFDPCTNLRMTAVVLQACYSKASKSEPDQQAALQQAISCYYSGNLKRGFVPERQFSGTSHVQRVLANADGSPVTVPALQPGARRTAPVAPVIPANAMPPTYQSWDVLRQYPHYEPAPASPAAPATPQEKPTPKETPDETIDA
jgi:type IV secretion system protein VirB1